MIVVSNSSPLIGANLVKLVSPAIEECLMLEGFFHVRNKMRPVFLQHRLRTVVRHSHAFER